MPEATIAAGFAKALMDLAVSKGVSRAALIERSRIDPAELADQDNRIPLANYLALFEAGTDSLDEPALALHFGEAFSFPELSIVGLVSQSAETASEAFELFNRYARLVLDPDDGETADWCELKRDETGLWLQFTSELYVKHRPLAESGFARCMSAKARAAVETPFAREIHFTHDEPNYREEYDRVFQMPVIFGSDRNAVLVDESFTSQRIGPPNRYVFGILSEHAEVLLKSLKNSKTIKGRVESLLIPILHTGDLSMARIANKLGLSRQTLYRRLKAEGVNYETLLDDLRHQMALHYLSGKKASVNETAFLVGYSHPNAFSRAFKRWTGRNPSFGK